jgi:hypothetical protein
LTISEGDEGCGVVEWFMPRRLVRAEGGKTVLQTELADVSGGRIIVETHLSRSGSWETTICPGDDPDPEGLQAALFAVCPTAQEPGAAHEQAVEFAATALNSTVRRVQE